MTIGEKLEEIHPCKHSEGLYEFYCAVDERDGILKHKRFKRRLDYEFVKAEDGSDFVSGKQLRNANIGISIAISSNIKEETHRVFRSMVLGIAIHGCKMLSPIHIYELSKEYIRGEAIIEKIKDNETTK